MRTKYFILNSVFSIIEQITIAIVGLLLPRIMINFYGSEINGLVISITQFIGYFKLVEAGISTASIFALFKPIADKNNEEISRIVRSTQDLYTKSGLMFLIGVFILCIFYPWIIKTNQLSYTEISFLVLIIGLIGGLDFFILGKFRVLITADKKQYIISLSSILYTLSNFIIVYLMAENNVNIYTLKAFSILSFIPRVIPLYFYSLKNYKYIFEKSNSLRTSIPNRWDAFYIQILGATQSATPIMLATIFSDLTHVSIFSIYLMVFSSLSGILGIFSSSISSIFGDIIAKKEEYTLLKTYSQFETAYYIIITIVFSVAILSISSFVKIYSNGVTDINYVWPELGVLLGINALLYNLKVPQGMMIMSSGRFRETKIQSTVQVLLIVVFGIFLGYYWGIIGVIIASIISNGYRVIDLLIYVPKHILKTSVDKTILKILLSIIIFSSSVYLSNILDLSINSLTQWLLYCIILVILYAVFTLCLFFISNKKDITSILKRLLLIMGGLKK